MNSCHFSLDKTTSYNKNFSHSINTNRFSWHPLYQVWSANCINAHIVICINFIIKSRRSQEKQEIKSYAKKWILKLALPSLLFRSSILHSPLPSPHTITVSNRPKWRKQCNKSPNTDTIQNVLTNSQALRLQHFCSLKKNEETNYFFSDNMKLPFHLWNPLQRIRQK